MTRLWRRLRSADDGMSTVEYAIGIVTACTFAYFLYKLVTGPLVEDVVTNLIKHALSLIPL